MLRLAVRLTAVLAIVAVGWIAIAKARSGNQAPAETAQASESPSAKSVPAKSAPAKSADAPASRGARSAADAAGDETQDSTSGDDPFFSAKHESFSDRYGGTSSGASDVAASGDDTQVQANPTAADPFSAEAADDSAAAGGGFSAPSYRNLPASSAASAADDDGPAAGGSAAAAADVTNDPSASPNADDPFAGDSAAAAANDAAREVTGEITDIGPPTVPAVPRRNGERYGVGGTSAAFKNTDPKESTDDPFAADPLESTSPSAAPPLADTAADDLGPPPGTSLPDAAADSGDIATDSRAIEPRRIEPRQLAPLEGEDSAPAGVPPVGSAADSSVDPYRGTASSEGYSPSDLERPANTSRQESFPPDDLREAVLADEGPGVPGDKRLEGAQLPALSIVKLAPQEIQVGKPATFEIEVQNTGRVPAHGVIVRDQVPRGTSFRGAEPQAAVSPAGELEWSLESLQPGDKRQIKIELLPLREGVVGSVATVHLAAQASVRTLCTKPELRIDVLSPPSEVLIGGDVTLNIRISNPGSGPATGILLTEHMPPGLTHSDVQGDQLEYEVGDLKPKESRDIKLRLKAAQAGPLENLLTAVGDGSLRAEARTQVQVVAPALAVAIDGPRHRYLERPAVYAITLKNEGTASAKEVQLAAYIPKGFKFVSANNLGSFDKASRIVAWELAELPPNLPAVVEVKLVPLEPGDQTLEVTSKGRQDLFAQAEHAVKVEGVAALQFQVVDTADPIEIGGETTYEVSVVNQGSKSASDVRLTAVLPPELEGVDASGPSESQVRGNRVEFAPLRTLAPRAEVTFKIRAKAAGPGNPQLRVELTSADSTDPVIKQESTRVYADR